MLGRKSFTAEEFAAGRAFVDATVAALSQTNGAVEAQLVAAAFLGLDRLYVHRLRTVAGPGTNPCTELTHVVEALMTNKGVLTAVSPLKYKQEATVLGLALGDAVPRTADAFERLANAFLADLAVRFPEV